MPFYSYKCDTCGRTEDKFRRVEDRKKEFECDDKITVKITAKRFGCVDVTPINNEHRCPGTMRIQPVESMRGGSFKMHDPTEREAQYGGKE